MAREPTGAGPPSGRSARRLPGQPNPTYAADVVARDPHNELPASFAQAVASLRPVRLRAEIKLAEAPAPQRLAPFAVALTADVADGAGASLSRISARNRTGRKLATARAKFAGSSVCGSLATTLAA